MNPQRTREVSGGIHLSDRDFLFLRELGGIRKLGGFMHNSNERETGDGRKDLYRACKIVVPQSPVDSCQTLWNRRSIARSKLTLDRFHVATTEFTPLRQTIYSSRQGSSSRASRSFSPLSAARSSRDEREASVPIKSQPEDSIHSFIHSLGRAIFSRCQPNKQSSRQASSVQPTIIRVSTHLPRHAM